MSQPRARCQPLEPRLLLAGDVQILIEARVLEITGDSLDNALGIEFDAGVSAYRATGLEGTTVNGAPGALFTIPDDVEGIVASLGDGRDQLILRGITAGNVPTDINAGAGRDSVLVDDSTLGNLSYQGELGIDWFGLYFSDVEAFTGGGGGDRDTLDVRNSNIAADLFWNDRSGPGGFYAGQTQINGNLDFASADVEPDTDGPFNVWIELRNMTITGLMGITTAAGNDRLLFRDNTLFSGHAIDLDGGDDEIDSVPPLD